MNTLSQTPSISSLINVGIRAGHPISKIVASVQDAHNVAALEEETEQISVACMDGGARAMHFSDRDFALYVWLRDTAIDQDDLVLEMDDTSDTTNAGGEGVSVSIAEVDGARFYNFGNGFTCAIEDFFGDLSWYDEDWVWVPNGESDSFGHDSWSQIGELEEVEG